MNTEEFSSDELIESEPTEVINTDEQITDYTFLSKLSKRSSVLDFDYEFFGFCLD